MESGTTRPRSGQWHIPTPSHDRHNLISSVVPSGSARKHLTIPPGTGTTPCTGHQNTTSSHQSCSQAACTGTTPIPAGTIPQPQPHQPPPTPPPPSCSQPTVPLHTISCVDTGPRASLLNPTPTDRSRDPKPAKTHAMVNPLRDQPRTSTLTASLHPTPIFSFNDPTAGSPTVTLLRLLLPLNGQVWSGSAGRLAASSIAGYLPRPNPSIQSVVATGGVYKGQGRNQPCLMNRAY